MTEKKGGVKTASKRKPKAKAERPTAESGVSPASPVEGKPTGESDIKKPDRLKKPERPPMGRATIAPALHDPKQRAEWGLPDNDTEAGPYMIELNLLYRGGLQEASRKFVDELYPQVVKDPARAPVPISKTYYRCDVSVREWRQLIREDEKAPDRRDRVIYRIWPDFPINPLIDYSVATVKADAAFRSYDATGAGIVWAVIDSGINANHLHFGDSKDPSTHTLLHPDVVDLHRDYSGSGPVIKGTLEHALSDGALSDGFGHGTHVAGIIAGGLKGEVEIEGGLKRKMECGKDFHVYERVFESDPDGTSKTERLDRRPIKDPTRLRGIAPSCRLISLKVLNNEGAGRASNVMAALQYIRDELNGDPKLLRVHGVNLSLGYEFDAEMFACGQSPLCVEVDRLVKSGVVVVVASGNTGYGRFESEQRRTKVGLANTINDPGNAALAITVGATHRDSPHLYGVSYFSSKGPTGDGRLKPDLVAPGERITSCAAGKKLAGNGGEVPDVEKNTAYIDDTGTSMAAPHVSGAIAAFLSIRREFIQRPEDVKRIFLDSATTLGRERYFEGHGMLDLMRAIQSV